jgi:hypothetical protein
VIREVRPQKVVHLGRDEDVLPRDPALLDRVSDLSLVLHADVSVGWVPRGNIGVRTP